MPDPTQIDAAMTDVLTYYRQNANLINQVVDGMITEVAPQPGDDPAVTFAGIVAVFAKDRDRATLAAAAAIMRLAEVRAAQSPDNPVHLAGYEQGRTDFLADRANGLARRGDAVEAWIKRYRDEQSHEHMAHNESWCALDDLLDTYRLHADTGTPLDSREPMGPTTAGVDDDA